MKQNRIYLNNNKALNYKFEQNKHDFVVTELPYEFSNSGNFFIMKIKKQYTSTWELINTIATKLDIEENKIGYAGLKDKNATTTQYISIPLNRSRDYELINSKNIEVLETFKHNQKIKIGDLKGNRFKITLKNIDPNNLHIFYQNLSKIQKHGLPNYFGYQRFGKENNFEKSRAITYGEESLSDKKLEEFLVFAYQSYFFNDWLCKRIELSKEKSSNKLVALDGDIFSLKDKTTITGLLPGRKIVRAKNEARKIEELYDDEYIHQKGNRRDAWIYPQNIKNRYISDKNWMELEFELPSSSYATVFIEAVLNKMLSY